MTTVPFGARQLHREVDDGVRLGRGRHQRAVRAVAAGQIADQRLAPRRHRSRRRRDRAPSARSTRAASRSRPITRQPAALSSCTVIWPMRPRPTTHDALAELRRGAPDALQRDRADGRRRGLLQVAAGRDAADEIARDVDVVRVIRLARAGGRDQIAGREIGDARRRPRRLRRRPNSRSPSPARSDRTRPARPPPRRRRDARLARARQPALGHLRQPPRGLARIAQAGAEVVSGEPRALEVALDRAARPARDTLAGRSGATSVPTLTSE